MAIFDFYTNVLCHVDKKKPVCAIFCDMTQAFDYVDHDILIDKLEAYGIRGNVLTLIASYLKDRSQITEIARINNETKLEVTYHSLQRSVKYGIPQGSVLGPLLFIIYINDMPKALNQAITLFADDSTVTVNCNDIKSYEIDINNSLISLIKWLNNNNLKINLKKTNIMHFSQRAQNCSNINLGIDGKKINQLDNVRFLGLQIDKKLNWKSQIQKISKKVSSLAYALHKLSPTVNKDTLLMAYYGMVESVLRYGIIFWGNSADREVAFKSQKRCIRAIFKLKVDDSCKPLFIKHKILTLPSLYLYEVAVFVKNNPHLFPKKCDYVIRNRRDDGQLYIKTAKTALMHKSIVCMGPKIYNKLPTKLRELNGNLFKNRMKRLLLETCY